MLSIGGGQFISMLHRRSLTVDSALSLQARRLIFLEILVRGEMELSPPKCQPKLASRGQALVCE